MVNRYTKQERDQLKKMFNDHYSKYDTHLSYKQILQHYIIDYGGIKNDDKYIVQYFKNISMDMQNDSKFETESFYIKLK